MKIGLRRIPKARNAEATGLARTAARSRFTPTELAEIAKRLRAKKEMTKSEGVAGQSMDVKDSKTILEPKTTNLNIEKQAPGQDTRAKAR